MLFRLFGVWGVRFLLEVFAFTASEALCVDVDDDVVVDDDDDGGGGIWRCRV